jgi:hypothetical protein
MSDTGSLKVVSSTGAEVIQNPSVLKIDSSLDYSVSGDELTIKIKDSGVSTDKLADGAVSAAKLRGSEARTSTADGTTTGAITPPTAFRTFIAVTSASATNQIALPAISASTIGQEIFLSVGANGYELITPASSNNTINLVDADGTNQLDVAANTTVRATQVSATSWLCETIAATTIAVTAPDND